MSILRFSDMYFRLVLVNIVQEENQPVVNETYQGASAQVPKPNMPNECYDGWISEIFSREQFSGSRIVGDLIEPSQAAVRPVAVESREVPVTCKKNCKMVISQVQHRVQSRMIKYFIWYSETGVTRLVWPTRLSRHVPDLRFHNLGKREFANTAFDVFEKKWFLRTETHLAVASVDPVRARWENAETQSTVFWWPLSRQVNFT